MRPAPTPAPVAPTPPAPVEDIWGTYSAAWKKDAPVSTYGNVLGGATSDWKPATFQPFDVSKYLRRGAGTTGSSSSNGSQPWWEAQPKAAPKAQQPWWEALTQDLPEDAPTAPATPSYKPAYKAYVPRGNAWAKPYTPAVKWEAAPVKSYWWQK